MAWVWVIKHCISTALCVVLPVLMESPLNILMISPQFAPIVGGYERAAERLAAALVARGHQVTVITDRRRLAWPAREVREGVQIQRLWCLFRPHWHMLTALSSTALFLLWHGRRYDVWHVHQYGQQAIIAVILGKLLRRPVVLKLTSSAGQGLSAVVSRGRFPALSAYWLTQVAAVIALTRETEREARAFGIPPERVHVLGNGLDTGSFAPLDSAARAEVKRSLGFDAYKLILCVGRLSGEKNPDGLLQAWAIAREKLGGEWKLILVGDGPLRPVVEEAVMNRGLSSQVVIAGPQDNIAQWMGVADIYVLPSNNEGLSNTLLEAMACGLPVVATRVSGVSELVEETGAGLAMDIGDVPALAEALVRLGGDAKLRAAAGARARQVVESRYAITRVAAAHAALYRRLLAGRLN